MEEREEQENGKSLGHGTASTPRNLPEDCISHILSLTSPSDACRSSVVSSGFLSAAQSDTVWEKFLPSDLDNILSRSVTPLLFPSKKQLYVRLCQSPILLDGGNKSFLLDKSSGKKCFMLGARELSITWGDDERYWNWDSRSVPKSRFPEVALLRLVWWLDIGGKIRTKMLSPNTKYTVFFVYFLTRRSYGLDSQPAKVSVGFVESEDDVKISYLQSSTSRFLPQEENALFPRERGDGWLELEMGEFFNGEEDGILRMRLRETEILSEKSGIVVQGIELRPHRQLNNAV